MTPIGKHLKDPRVFGHSMDYSTILAAAFSPLSLKTVILRRIVILTHPPTQPSTSTPGDLIRPLEAKNRGPEGQWSGGKDNNGTPWLPKHQRRSNCINAGRLGNDEVKQEVTHLRDATVILNI